MDSWKTIAKTRYVDDKQITDHYALIPTGQGLGALKGLSSTAFGVYCTIVKRFLGIFYPPAVYRRISLVLDSSGEKFFASFRILEEEGSKADSLLAFLRARLSCFNSAWFMSSERLRALADFS